MLLKKITGNVVFKAVWLIVVLGYFFFTMYGNLNGIRLKDSETYKVQYNEQAEEYYIIPLKQEASLELFVPVGTEDIEFTAVSNGKENDSRRFTTKQYKEQGYTVTADKYDAIKNDGLWNKTLQLSVTLGQSHPFSAVRVREILKWGKSPQYKNLMERLDINSSSKTCDKCKSAVSSEWGFCKYCGNKLK